jgi:hypothetical protein
VPFHRAFRAASRPFPLFAAIALGSLAVSCGGATPASHTLAGHADDSSSHTDVAAQDGAPEAPQAPSCDDGTCFSCGDGICPTGFYCDRKAPGGPACSWLPACAKQATCSCVQKALGSGCSCQREGGGIYVDCE